MQNQQRAANAYSVDLVMCIDGTGSMNGIIDKVKEQALSFYDLFMEAMRRGGKAIRDDHFRVKVIVFRDYMENDYPAMEESEFFDMTKPEGVADFERFVRGIEANGGGDDPENALEAIFKALKSDWVREGGRYRRHVIMVFTDVAALPLQHPKRAIAPDYPLDAPGTREELCAILEEGDGGQSKTYGSYSAKNGRLIVFAPKDQGWEWVRTVDKNYYIETKIHGGCDDIDIEQAMAVLVGSF